MTSLFQLSDRLQTAIMGWLQLVMFSVEQGWATASTWSLGAICTNVTA